MKPVKFFISAVLFIMVSCNRGPQPIEIGKDLCELCKMTIMDRRFGAEIITSKGKIYKFDSNECLINFLKEYPDHNSTARGLYVIDHSRPGELIEAKSAFYLHSEKLPSPMGANLSSVQERRTIDEYFSVYGGEIKSWEEVYNGLP